LFIQKPNVTTELVSNGEISYLDTVMSFSQPYYAGLLALYIITLIFYVQVKSRISYSEIFIFGIMPIALSILALVFSTASIYYTLGLGILFFAYIWKFTKDAIFYLAPDITWSVTLLHITHFLATLFGAGLLAILFTYKPYIVLSIIFVLFTINRFVEILEHDRRKDCHVCDMRGYVMIPKMRNGKAEPHAQSCPECKGKGYNYRNTLFAKLGW